MLCANRPVAVCRPVPQHVHTHAHPMPFVPLAAAVVIERPPAPMPLMVQPVPALPSVPCYSQNPYVSFNQNQVPGPVHQGTHHSHTAPSFYR